MYVFDLLSSQTCFIERLLTCSGSRRLITYRRIPDAQLDATALATASALGTSTKSTGLTANQLNPFRRRYFSKFAPVETAALPMEADQGEGKDEQSVLPQPSIPEKHSAI